MNTVKKFGGSSLATVDQIKNIALLIKAQKKSNDKIIIVCSAMGQTTNEFIANANKLSTNLPNREMDLLLSSGENISICYLVFALNEIGIKAKAFTGSMAGIITNDNYNKSFIRRIKTKKIKEALNNGYVCVVAGFQGITENGEITTFGRGGSDITAVALAAKLKFNCEIFTDVDGIYTMDPRIYKIAKKLGHISYNEMIEMSLNGAKVLDTRCVEIAKKYNVKIYLGKTGENEKKGTYVMKKKYFENMPITSFAIRKTFRIINIRIKQNQFEKVMNTISKYNLNYELLNQNKLFDSYILTFGSSQISESLIEDLTFEFKKENLKLFDNLCKLTIVGIGFATHNSQLEKIQNILSENNIYFDYMYLNDTSLSFILKQEYSENIIDLLSSKLGLKE